ncbi:DUF6443 domain-containing protein [Fulvivirga maritima]|uniref:DUF6443 domain-containing protein n=1 Tax=Fulvivirga maritima TaxID=2904247 RepID=UPI001F453742|nr:DUF6443 domain-containing protein [Fulvivirga maritima]UII27588.1 DUF6443 domain-containing protein [Fulvivirga maritima]
MQRIIIGVLALIFFGILTVNAQQEKNDKDIIVPQMQPPDWGGGGSGGGGPSYPAPARPPAPTISTNSCGTKTLTRADPPSGVSYCWQTTETGTSLGNAYKTITVNTSGYYYLKATDIRNRTWSDPTTVYVSVNKVNAPDAPVQKEQSCNNVKLERGTPPAGVTWYWQGKNASGTDVSNSSKEYSAVSSGTYYLRGRLQTSPYCWGPSKSITVSLSGVPPTPSEPSITMKGNNYYLNVVSPSSNVIYYWKDENGSVLSNQLSLLLSDPSKTYYLSAKSRVTGCWSNDLAVNVRGNVPPAPVVNVTTNTCGPKTVSVSSVPENAFYTFYWQGTDQYGKLTTDSDLSKTITSSGTYYFRGKTKSGDVWGPAVGVQVNYIAAPSNVVAQDKVMIGAGYNTFAVNNHSNDIYWFSTSSLGSSINVTPSSYLREWVDVTTTRYAAAYNSSDCSSTREPVTITVLPLPIISGQTTISIFDKTAELTTNYDYDSYQWFRNGFKIEGATSRNYTTEYSGYYQVEVNVDGALKAIRSDYFKVEHLQQAENHTYQVARKIKVAGVTSDIIAQLEPGDFQMSVSYIDHYGRRDQDILVGASPSGKDIIQGYEYDEYGRQKKSYLPYTDEQNQAKYRSSWQSRQRSFYSQYNTGGFRDPKNSDYAYSEVEYEDSPLGRVVKSAAPGVDWQIEGEHIQTQTYSLNNGNDGIIKWIINENTGLPERDGFYSAGWLSINKITDEHGITSESFTDLEGRSVCTIEAGEKITYSVYDNKGRLRYVFQPELVNQLTVSGSDPSAVQLKHLAFCYNYDHKNRIIESKTPGADWSYMIYDDQDRLVLSQDANQREQEAWIFTKYDRYDRAIIAGQYKSSKSREAIQDQIDAFYSNTYQWQAYTGVAEQKGVLTKTAATGWGNGGGVSTVMLEDGKDGEVVFRAGQVNAGIMVGFSEESVNDHYNTIKYALHFGSDGKVNIYEAGSKVSANVGVYTVDDFFAVERIGGVIYYKKNDEVIYTSKKSSTSSLVVDFSINHNNAQIEIIMPNYYEEQGGQYYLYTNRAFPVVITKEDLLALSYYDSYDFKALPEFGLTYDYSSSELESASGAQVVYSYPQNAFERIKGLPTGGKVRVIDGDWLNSVNYYDSKYRLIQNISDNHKGGQDIVSNIFDFSGQLLKTKTTHRTGSYDVAWKDLVNVTVDGKSVTKTTGESASWDADAVSSHLLRAGENGWVEMTMQETDKYRMFGLADVNENSNYRTLDYAIYARNNGTVLVYENGSSKGEKATYKTGDKLSVERIGKKVYYKKNGKIIYESTKASATDLMVDVSLRDVDATIYNAKASFAKGEEEESAVVRTYTYDHAGRLLSTRHELGTNPHFQDANGVQVKGNTLVKSGSNSAYDAGAATVSMIEPNEDGWISVQVKGDNRMLFGLADSNEDEGYTTIDYALFTYPKDKRIAVYRNGSTVKTLDSYEEGDILKVAREGAEIKFYVNDVMLHSISADPSVQLMGDFTIYEPGHSINNIQMGTSVLLSQYEYDERGQLIEKNLHSADDGATYAQSIDYAYNIRGWLTSINDATLDGSLEHNPDQQGVKDYFGMNLGYQADLGLEIGEEKLQYNGAISAIKWSNINDGENTSSYAYGYDKYSRLTSAQEPHSMNNAYNLDHVSYDLNGNIQGLTRRNQSGDIMDDLEYNYGIGSVKGNQIMSVTDHASIAGGFNEGDAEENDYSYNNAGSITKDLNKGILNISYNLLGLPDKIEQKDGSYLKYIYSASGAKLSQEYYDSDGYLLKVTEYSGQFLYEKAQQQTERLVMVHTEEGRVVNDVLTGWEYQYDLTDHLGNTRVSFTTKPKTVQFSLNYEELGEDDMDLFENVETEDNDLYDHTDVKGETYTKTQMLDGTEGKQVGSVIAIPVAAGDAINAKVYAKYEGEVSVVTPVGATTAIASTLIGILTGGATTVVDGGVSTITNNFGVGSIIGGSGFPVQNNDAPMAFLNVMFLPSDNSIELVKDATFAYDQISVEGQQPVSIKHNNFSEMSVEDFVAPAAGIVMVYLSNEGENQEPVYFDDLEITVNESAIIQTNDYYPYGMASKSWNRATNLKNKYLYNAGSELNELTQNYETPFRRYDPALGRFNGIDRMAGSQSNWSPYHFGFNNPVSHNDPTGLYPPLTLETLNEADRNASRYNGGGAGHIGVGSGNHWSDEYSTGFGVNSSFEGWAIHTGNYNSLAEGHYANQGNGNFYYTPLDPTNFYVYSERIGNTIVGGYESSKYEARIGVDVGYNEGVEVCNTCPKAEDSHEFQTYINDKGSTYRYLAGNWIKDGGKDGDHLIVNGSAYEHHFGRWVPMYTISHEVLANYTKDYAANFLFSWGVTGILTKSWRLSGVGIAAGFFIGAGQALKQDADAFMNKYYSPEEIAILRSYGRELTQRLRREKGGLDE